VKATLDARWATGLDRMDGLVSSQAISRYAPDLARLPTDATRLKVDGAYARDAGPAGPLSPGGYRRDHRPDLKPLRFGLTVTAQGVPVWGHVTDGNQRDSPEPRGHRPPVRQHRPALGEPLLGADSPGFAGETMPLAAAPRLRLVPLGPQTVGLRQALVEAPALSALPGLWEQPGRRQGERAQDRGAAGVRPYRGKTGAGEGQESSRRWLVVESTQLAKAKAPRWAAAQQAARVMLAALQQPWQRRTCACEAAAPQAATLGRRERRWHQPPLPSTVSAEGVTAKRTTRGRPPPDALPPPPQVWRVMWQGPEASPAGVPLGARHQCAGPSGPLGCGAAAGL
jgi:hypothetical protein